MPMEDFYEALCIMNWISKPDDLGGFHWEWEDGADFKGGIVLNSTTEMRIAQQSGAKGIYALTTDVSIPIAPGDVIKRLRDDALFKVTSDPEDKKTPGMSDIKGMQVTLERVTV